MAYNYLIEPINKKKNSKIFQEQLAKYATYYYYPRNQTNENIQAYPKSVNIENIDYIYSDPIEKKKLMEFYDLKHFLMFYYQLPLNAILILLSNS